MTIYAYARVSAHDQNLARQLDAFQKFGIIEQNVYADKKSGKDFERGNYRQLLAALQRDDLLVIKSIDRLGRNYDSIIEEWNAITNQIGADILVLDMPLLDTRTKADTLVGKFISDVVLQVLSFVAENERANIRARQAEGIRAARERGVKLGRPPKTYTQEFMELAFKYKQKNVPLEDALFLSGMKYDNFYYHLSRMSSLGIVCNR